MMAVRFELTPRDMKSADNPGLGDRESPEGEINLSLAWDILKELGASERHFNNPEVEYRTLASIWLLAGFSGTGFILKANPQLALPREVALVAIGLAASRAVTTRANI